MDFLTVVNPYFPDVTLLAYVFRVLLVGPQLGRTNNLVIQMESQLKFEIILKAIPRELG